MSNRKYKRTADAMNELQFQYYYAWLQLITLNLAEWKGLPDYIPVRFLEQTLYNNGIAVYCRDDEIEKDTIMRVNLTGNFDRYGIPVGYHGYSPNGYTRDDLNESNSVLIWNNYLRRGSDTAVQIFAYRLANIDRSIDVNVSAQKTPVMVLCDDKMRTTFINMVESYDGNQPFIFADPKLKMGSTFEAVQTEAPYVADKLEALKHSIFNDFLSWLGIENSNEDKKERMVADEVNSNYGIVEASRNITMTTRVEAAAKINSMFGTNITVGFNSKLPTLVNQFQRENGLAESDIEIPMIGGE